MSDTIIREIRQTRDELAQRFHFDMHELCLELRREQEIGLTPVVTFAAESSSAADRASKHSNALDGPSKR